MLSAGSFSSPYEHLSQPETKRMVEHYTAYLSDNTRLIANPGLKVHNHTTPRVTHTSGILILKVHAHTFYYHITVHTHFINEIRPGGTKTHNIV